MNGHTTLTFRALGIVDVNLAQEVAKPARVRTSQVEDETDTACVFARRHGEPTVWEVGVGVRVSVPPRHSGMCRRVRAGERRVCSWVRTYLGMRANCYCRLGATHSEFRT
jgi:hypothetical protein